MKKAALDAHTKPIPIEIVASESSLSKSRVAHRSDLLKRSQQPFSLPSVGIFPCACKLVQVVHYLKTLLMGITCVLCGVPRDLDKLPC